MKAFLAAVAMGVLSMMAGCEACDDDEHTDAAVGVPTEPDIGAADPVPAVDAGAGADAWAVDDAGFAHFPIQSKP